MDEIERSKLHMLKQVKEFGIDNAEVFPASSLGGELFAAISKIVDELSAHGAAQSSGSSDAREGNRHKALARAALRDDLKAIRRTARAITLYNPGVADKFRIPRLLNDQNLLNTARAFAADAAPLKADFIRHELPEDFLEDLNDDIDAFEKAISTVIQGTKDQVTATASIDEIMEQAMDVMDRLDPIVRNKFRNQSGILASWVSASHTERLPRPSKKPQPPPQT